MSNKILLLVWILGSSCAQQNVNTPSLIEEAAFEASAVEFSNLLKDQGFSCLAKGRELYPQVYSCEGEGAIDAFIYADDRGQIEGIRLFGPVISRKVWMKELLLQIYSDSTATQVAAAFETANGAEAEFRLHSFVFELNESDGRSIFRISPTSAIQTSQ